MKPLLLLAFVALGSCSAWAPTFTRTGPFAPGTTIAVRNIQGDVNAYAPAHGQPQDDYTISVYEPGNAPRTSVRLRPPLLLATAHAPGVRFLVRAPHGAALDLSTMQGDINVADFDGVVNAHTGHGDIKMLIPMYGGASIGQGNMSVIFASTDWPGTVRFTIERGNAEVYVNQHAKAHVRLHTDNGTVFSDFDIRGTSRGTGETIDTTINGGGPRTIDIEVKTGSVRLMQLKPQI